jgi:hypothetical protein
MSCSDICPLISEIPIRSIAVLKLLGGGGCWVVVDMVSIRHMGEMGMAESCVAVCVWGGGVVKPIRLNLDEIHFII